MLFLLCKNSAEKCVIQPDKNDVMEETHFWRWKELQGNSCLRTFFNRFPKKFTVKIMCIQISSKSTEIWFPKLLQWWLSIRYISCCNSFLSRKLISLLPKTTDITTKVIYCDLTISDCVNSKQVIPSDIAGATLIAEAPPTAALFQLL